MSTNVTTRKRIKERDAGASEDAVTLATLSGGRGTISVKQSGYRLVVLVGVPLMISAYLLLQLHKLPNTSLSYSLLNAVISVLANLSSSALLKIFWFLMGLFGVSRSVTSTQ